LFRDYVTPVYNWFNYLQQSGHYVVGYVIMPNHVHTVIAFRNTGKSINSIISNGKRFMAYEIIERLKQTEDYNTLKTLEAHVTVSERKQGKLHVVFEPSFDWKECRTDKFIIQKIDYIHHNPVKAGLCSLPEDYEHSSAKFYFTGVQGFYSVTSYTELQDVDLTARL